MTQGGQRNAEAKKIGNYVIGKQFFLVNLCRQGPWTRYIR
jgi:hypothetical protein